MHAKNSSLNTPSIRNARWFGAPIDEWVGHIMAIHFNPVSGSPYWLRKEKILGINARTDIKTLDDLRLLGPMEEEDLRRYPTNTLFPKFISITRKILSWEKPQEQRVCRK